MTSARKIRATLKDTDGKTVKQILQALDLPTTPNKCRVTIAALKVMPDAYIDRWEGPYRGQWAAVWAVVDVPEDAPRPTSGREI